MITQQNAQAALQQIARLKAAIKPLPRDLYCIHSGGAKGVDHIFGKFAEEYGIPIKHYYTGERSAFNSPYGNTEISLEDYQEGRIEAARAANYNWGYPYISMKDPRLIRNWSQVKHSDIVVAISTIVEVGEPVFPNQPGDTRTAIRQCVAGGTGYAVAMAILHCKPVYVYDLNKNHWFKFDNLEQRFVKCNCPKLAANTAGIGTRNLNFNALRAINELFLNTFKE